MIVTKNRIKFEMRPWFPYLYTGIYFFKNKICFNQKQQKLFFFFFFNSNYPRLELYFNAIVYIKTNTIQNVNFYIPWFHICDFFWPATRTHFAGLSLT